MRIFTREGTALLPMFKKCEFIWKDNSYRNQIMSECRQMAKSYPSYLASRNNIVLSEHALEILKLQSEGKSSADIAKELKISEATVKYLSLIHIFTSHNGNTVG